jgi:Flp pilus assembly protein TadB
MNEWIAHLHRDRYEIIRDERDAYIQLQDQVSGEIHEATKQMESSVQDREQLKIELAEAHMQTSRAREVIIAALSRLHVNIIYVLNFIRFIR